MNRMPLVLFTIALGAGWARGEYTPPSLDQIILTPVELSSACQLIDARKPARSDAQVFYEHTVNSSLLPLFFKKMDQGIQCGRDKGVVYYYQYNDAAGREQVELAARGRLWGSDTQATEKHPEQIF